MTSLFSAGELLKTLMGEYAPDANATTMTVTDKAITIMAYTVDDAGSVSGPVFQVSRMNDGTIHTKDGRWLSEEAYERELFVEPDRSGEAVRDVCAAVG